MRFEPSELRPRAQSSRFGNPARAATNSPPRSAYQSDDGCESDGASQGGKENHAGYGQSAGSKAMAGATASLMKAAKPTILIPWAMGILANCIPKGKSMRGTAPLPTISTASKKGRSRYIQIHQVDQNWQKHGADDGHFTNIKEGVESCGFAPGSKIDACGVNEQTTHRKVDYGPSQGRLTEGEEID